MSSENRKAHLTGGCQCGAVRFALYSEPTKIGLCHCRMCQKALGAPFGVFVVTDLADFAWTKGKPAGWQSSNRAFREFCGACGTPLAFRPTDKPIMEMMSGAFDEPSKVVPAYEVGREGKLEWVNHIGGFPGKTTLENMGTERLGRIVNMQHPDRDA